MNKKKIIIIASVVLLAIILGVLGFLLFGGKKTDDKPNSDVIVSSIFLEINPSIRIDLDKDEKIINVVALNDDAKDIIPNEFKGKEIPETIDNITEKLVEKGYAKEEVIILVNTTGKIKCESVKEIINNSLSKKEIKSNVIEPEITESSKELAKKLNISETKAAYIESITKENPEIKAEDIKDKSVLEITEIKEKSKEFTVNFDMDGTGDSAKVNNGEKVTKPANPTKNGYTFVEWQLDGVKFDFNTPITGDITLKAVWKKNETTSNNNSGSHGNVGSEAKCMHIKEIINNDDAARIAANHMGVTIGNGKCDVWSGGVSSVASLSPEGVCAAEVIIKKYNKSCTYYVSYETGKIVGSPVCKYRKADMGDAQCYVMKDLGFNTYEELAGSSLERNEPHDGDEFYYKVLKGDYIYEYHVPLANLSATKKTQTSNLPSHNDESNAQQPATE